MFSASWENQGVMGTQGRFSTRRESHHAQPRWSHTGWVTGLLAPCLSCLQHYSLYHPSWMKSSPMCVEWNNKYLETSVTSFLASCKLQLSSVQSPGRETGVLEDTALQLGWSLELLEGLLQNCCLAPVSSYSEVIGPGFRQDVRIFWNHPDDSGVWHR